MNNLTLRIPDELRTGLEEQAEAADRKLTDYIRHVLKIIVEHNITPYELSALREEEQ